MGNKVSSASVDRYQEYSAKSCDLLMSTRDMVSKLSTKHLEEVDKVLREKGYEDDLKIWKGLSKRKGQLLTSVQIFATETAAKLMLVKARLDDKNGNNVSLEQCYGGFNAEKTAKECDYLTKECESLRGDFEQFRIDLQQKYGVNILIMKRIAELIGSCTVFLGGVALLVLGCCVVVTAPFTILGVGLMTVSAVSTYALWTRKSDIEVAIEKLEDAEIQLKHMTTLLVQVRADSTVLSMVERRECSAQVEKIIKSCNKLAKHCAQAV